MLVHLRRSFTMCIICLVFFGFIYAFAGTGVAQLLFKFQANGSITANGSTLIVRIGPVRSSSTDAPTMRVPTRQRQDGRVGR